MRAFLAAGLFLALGTVAAADPGDWIPDNAAVAAVEAMVVMPKGAAPLKTYVRFYAGILAAPDRDPSWLKPGHKIIWGEYIGPLGAQSLPPDPIRVVPAHAMPRMGDGGCIVVNVYYDVPERRVAGILCNDTG